MTVAAAKRALGQGMKALGLGQAQLLDLPKGAPEKVALAWWMRQRTTVSLRWVSEQLQMTRESGARSDPA